MEGEDIRGVFQKQKGGFYLKNNLLLVQASLLTTHMNAIATTFFFLSCLSTFFAAKYLLYIHNHVAFLKINGQWNIFIGLK